MIVTFNIRVLDTVRLVMMENGLSLSTLLCTTLLPRFSMTQMVMVVIGFGAFFRFIRIALAGKWAAASKRTGLIKIVSIMATIGIAVFIFQPVNTNIIIIESDEYGHVTERVTEPSTNNTFSQFGLTAHHYQLPFIIGAYIHLFDYVFYHPLGIVARMFKSSYGAYITDPYAVIKNYDRLMASSHLENLLDIVSEETATKMTATYKKINHIHASVGEIVYSLDGYNNEKTLNFFKNAGIAKDQTLLEEETHGYFGGTPRLNMAGETPRGEINIAYLKGLSTPDYADKIRRDMLSINGDLDLARFVTNITGPIERSIAALDTIQADLTANLESISRQREMNSLLDLSRQQIRDAMDTLKHQVSLDIENIAAAIKYKKDKEAANEEEDTGGWFKNVVLDTGAYLALKPLDYVGNKVIRFIMFFLYLAIKILYMLLFLARSIYISLVIGSIIFSIYKSLLTRNLSHALTPVKEYLIYQVVEIGLICSWIISFKLPFYAASHSDEFNILGDSFSEINMTISLLVCLAIQLIVVVFFWKKAKWMLNGNSESQPDDGAFSSRLEGMARMPGTGSATPGGVVEGASGHIPAVGGVVQTAKVARKAITFGTMGV